MITLIGGPAAVSYMIRRLRRYLCWVMPVHHPGPPAPDDAYDCSVRSATGITPMGLNEMPPGSLLPGDLHLDALGFGFDETASAQRTLEFHDSALSCGCPADCAQHPWWPPR